MKKNKLNDGHYLEVMDRLHVIMDIMDRHLIDHLVIDKNENLKKLINFSIINLWECYQQVGKLSYENETRKENKKIVSGRCKKSKNKRLDCSQKLR